ncbi:SusC/RagA family TonB-linked outer membrane protein [Pedobacter alpinus]|uniref:SusC/RagA family TonB-linked outer membrane protein n=1 Tax=Pedobacter alpinus TaxID=1590643 RepID=A0ABW5TN98_9SPHI
MKSNLLNANKRLLQLKKSFWATFACLFIILSFQESVIAKDNYLKTNKNLTAVRKSINGTITDSKGEPLIGVSIKVKGSNSGTLTDINGKFTINVPEGSTLVISYLGFETREVKVAAQTEINITLNESKNSLDEVIITGYGEKKRSEIVGSVATITGEELMDIPAPNIAGAMRNRIAGVGVSQVSGRPGSGISLNIRNSTTSPTVPGGREDPLYVIDGITVEKDIFDNLDASMIETMTILKDASAAIYGAAGAKGVLLVTTKRGKIGKPSISYNGYIGVSDASRTPDMLSGFEHASLMNETFRVNNAGQSNFFSPTDLEYISSLNNESWYDQLWKASTTQRHNMSISGGSDKITFFAGGSYQNENANYAGMKFDKYSFRSGLTATILNGLKADINFNVDHSVRNAQHNLTENDAAFFESMITVPDWVPLSINDMLVNYNGNNPLGLLQSGYYDTRKSRGYRINASLSYQPSFLKGLSARVQVSQGSSGVNSRQYRPPYNLYNFNRFGNNGQLFTDELTQQPLGNPLFEAVSGNNTRVTPSLADANSYQGFFTLQYAKTIGKHTLDLTVGGEQTVSNNEFLSVFWTNQLIPGGEDWWAFDNNTLTRNDVRINENTKRSFFGRFNYDIDKKYLVEAVARLDASSSFASGNRWGLSPSIGLGWIVSKEDFFRDNISFINFLKFKVNYGITGDDRVEQRLWQERYLIDTSNGYLYGNNNGNSLNPGIFPNPNITWEKKQTFNAGIEMSLFNNKLDVGAEFFRNYTYDQFDRGGNNQFPLYSGFTAPVLNFRELYNWGSEFTIGYKAKIGKDLSLNSSMNFSYGNSVVDRTIYAPGNLVNNTPPNWLIAFGTDPRRYNSNNIGLRNSGMFRTQEQIDAFMVQNPNYRLYNQIPQPGWLYYEDTNGDGIINDWDMVLLNNNINPIIATGINLNLGYKSFNLSTNIAARIGGKVYYDGRARIAPSLTRNVLSIWEDRWTPDNPMEGRLPRFDDPSLTRNSDFWEVDGTTIRVNNMTLSYKVPAKIASRLGLGSARLLATGNNLWTIVNPLPYKDPNTSSAYDYPILRTISFGLSVNL